jgi:hypothetical protein
MVVVVAKIVRLVLMCNLNVKQNCYFAPAIHVFGFHCKPSVLTPSSLSSDKVCLVSRSSSGMASRKFELFEAHFLNGNLAVLQFSLYFNGFLDS